MIENVTEANHFGFTNKAFPAKPLKKPTVETGAWISERQNEQRRYFQAKLSYLGDAQNSLADESESDDRNRACLAKNFDYTLCSELLFAKSRFKDPTLLHEFDMCGMNLRACMPSNLQQFSSLEQIYADDNSLKFEYFQYFPALRRLDLPLNDIIKISPNAHEYFQKLQVLDLSYNALSAEDVFALGLLPSLAVLRLSGNNLTTLPHDLAQAHISDSGEIRQRFTNLKEISLDDNDFEDPSILASLATLPQLENLNLDDNKFKHIPLLQSLPYTNNDPDTPACSSRQKKKQTKKKGRKTHARHDGPPENDCLKVSAIKPTVSTDDEVATAIPSPVDRAMLKTNTPDHQYIRGGKSEPLGHAYDESCYNVELLNQMRSPLAPRVGLVNDLDEGANLSSSVAEIRRQVKSCMANIASSPGPLSLKGSASRRSSMLAPFPNLQVLTLRNNCLGHDASLLAASVWPSLKDLHIEGNPVCKAYNGIPPYTRKLLVELHNIRIFRGVPQVQTRPTSMPGTCLPRARKLQAADPLTKPIGSDIDRILQEIRETQLSISEDGNEPRAAQIRETADEETPRKEETMTGGTENVFLTAETPEVDASGPVEGEEFHPGYSEWDINNHVELPGTMQQCLCELRTMLDRTKHSHQKPPGPRPLHQLSTQKSLPGKGQLLEKSQCALEKQSLQKALWEERNRARKLRQKQTTAVGFGARSESRRMKLQLERFSNMTEPQRERWLLKQEQEKIKPSQRFSDISKIYESVKEEKAAQVEAIVKSQENDLLQRMDGEIWRIAESVDNNGSE